MIRSLITILLLSAVLAAQDISPDQPLDLNNASFEEILQLPLSRDLAERIYERITYQGPFANIFELRDVQGVDQETLLKLKSLVRIEPFRAASEREERLNELYFRLDQWGGDEGANQALVDSWIERALEPSNINEMRYDELLNLQSVSPVDAAAIVNYRNTIGRINSQRDLRSAPYLSYYGYRNASNFVSFGSVESKKAFHGNWMVRMTNAPFMTEEAEINTSTQGAGLTDAVSGSIISNQYPDVYSRLIASWGPDVKMGISHWHALGEPVFQSDLGFTQIPKPKFYIGLENRNLGPVQMRKFYVGNYSLAFGQGVIMENSDFFQPRKSGFGFRKSYIGLSGDNSRTRQYTLTGAATQLQFGNAHLYLFGGFDERDAILNRQAVLYNGELVNPVNQLIVLDQRFEYAPGDPARQLDSLGWRDSVKELLLGFHAAYDVLPATQIGFTYYESAYDRPLRPEITEIVGADNLGLITLPDNEIYASYGGSVSDGENAFWSDAKSFRRIYGVDFQSVYKNASFQAEYAELDKSAGMGLFREGRNPWAFVGSAYFQYNSFNFMALYRNYQTGFDNPYQRSFSNYRRYKRTIYEDYFYLQSSFYYQLYSNNPQPQAERGFYFNTRYQINRQFTLSMEYDNWLRNADDVPQYRLSGTLQFRPVFPITISLRQKYQGREALNDKTLEYYENAEFRGQLRLRLSRFNDLSLLYADSRVNFRPRPRLSFPTDPTDPGQNYDDTNLGGTAALPGTAIGATYTHNFNEWLKFRGFLGFYKGFLWNFEDTEFIVTNSERGATRLWFSVYSRISNRMSMRIKYTRDYQKAITFSQARDANNEPIEPGNSSYIDGRYYGASLIQPSQEYYYMEFNFHF
ncbi:MAG: helix-hairpin-helix domain-containing protein [Calditrichia bacterium]